MQYSKLVSVIVPVYNVENYLQRCVFSVVNQTYKNLEIILVNDGSSDGSADICNKLSNEDSRIKVIHKDNGGLSSARNAGLDVATGDYVSFIDSDDYISPTMIESMVSLMINHQAQIAITGRVDKYENTNKEIEAFKKSEIKKYSANEAIRNLLLRGEIDVSVCDKIFERNLFQNIRFPVGENNEDCAIIFKIFNKIDLAIHTNSCDYYYCHRSNSITTTLSTKTIANMIQHAEDTLTFITTNHPHLTEEAKYFVGFAYIIGYRDVAKKLKCYGETDTRIEKLYQHIKTEMIKHYGIGTPKKFFNFSQKRFFFLNAIGMYDLLMVAKYNLGRSKK